MPHTVTTQIAVDLYLHVRVLIGILLGLSVVRLVGGVARFVCAPGPPAQLVDPLRMGRMGASECPHVLVVGIRPQPDRVEFWNLFLRLPLRIHVFF